MEITCRIVANIYRFFRTLTTVWKKLLHLTRILCVCVWVCVCVCVCVKLTSEQQPYEGSLLRTMLIAPQKLQIKCGADINILQFGNSSMATSGQFNWVFHCQDTLSFLWGHWTKIYKLQLFRSLDQNLSYTGKEKVRRHVSWNWFHLETNQLLMISVILYHFSAFCIQSIPMTLWQLVVTIFPDPKIPCLFSQLF